MGGNSTKGERKNGEERGGTGVWNYESVMATVPSDHKFYPLPFLLSSHPPSPSCPPPYSPSLPPSSPPFLLLTLRYLSCSRGYKHCCITTVRGDCRESSDGMRGEEYQWIPF